MLPHESRKKICFVTTVEAAVRDFLLGHINALMREHDVTVVVNTSNSQFLSALRCSARVVPVPIERKISLLGDFKAFLQLISLFRRNRFDVVHSFAPKAGLLSMAAAYLTGIGIRIHVFTGQVWVTRTGLRRRFLKTMDRIVAALATHVLVDSGSQRDFLIAEKVVSSEKSRVLAKGSFCGVDPARYCSDPAARAEIRRRFGIAESEVVFLFLGRLNRDKGLLDLAQAFSRIRHDHDGVRLIFVGPDEEELRSRIIASYGAHAQKMHFEGYTDVPEQYMAAADVFCLPSYREGFGSVIIEAAAVGLPAIGTRIYGISDAIAEGESGFLCEPGDTAALAARMAQFITDPNMRKEMGRRARQRALRDFPKELVIAAMLDYYAALFRAAAASPIGT